jgi:hypothetical protein
MSRTIWSRQWAMPSADTFDVPPIASFVRHYLRTANISVDPFARNKRWATHTNDLNPSTEAEFHMDAGDFMQTLISRKVSADLIIFDPPYSPRQVAECYSAAGLTATMRDTQTAASKKTWREQMRELCHPGSIVLSFGWNTVGMGPGWITEEVMLVCHGGDHNDTICMADRMMEKQEIFNLGETQ